MAISRRQYATLADIAEYSNVTVTDEDEAADQLSMAEEMIDAYVGPQEKHVNEEVIGQATGGTTTTLIDISGDSYLVAPEDDYYKYCEVEIIKGTNAGERRSITAYDQSTNKITVSPAFSSAIDSTSVYVIKQLGKFPRYCDVKYLEVSGVNTYLKRIPEAVRRAALAQLEYIVEKGTDFFSGPTDLEGEGIGSKYNYTVKKNMDRMIAPAARKFLHGIMNRTGSFS